MILKEVKKNGYILRIIQDEDVQNPRETNENVGTMITFSSRYRLGDEHNYEDYQTALLDVASELGIARETDVFCHDVVSKFYNEAYVLPLYVYEHSGITISTTPFSCKFDSCRVGFIYTSKEVLEKFGLGDRTREEVLSILRGEVEYLDMYLRGDCFGYTISKEEKCECCGHIEEDEVDSCWGFIGTEVLKILSDNISNEYKFLLDELGD